MRAADTPCEGGAMPGSAVAMVLALTLAMTMSFATATRSIS